MNQNQVKYARERIDKIYQEKLKALTEKHTSVAIYLTLEEKIDAIQQGRYEIGPEEWRGKESMARIRFLGEQSSKLDRASYAPLEKALKDRYQQLLDDLILGDAEEALKAIHDFAAFRI